ncbi:MAG TPA: hypothetical protein VFW96_26210 [Thermomicrobiales bacterium]|nr:hypothetical protein [Thermomicrobiales bacterium]
MRQIARGALVALMLLLGLVLGVGGLVVALLLGVRPPALAAAAPAQQWDVTLSMSDAFLTARLGEGGQGGGQAITLQGAKVACRDDGTVVITGNVGAGTTGGARPPIAAGVAVPVEIVLRPSVADGQLKTEVVSATFGPLPVPAQLDSLLDGPINSRVASAVGNQPVRLVELTVRQGGLTVRAKRA